MDQDLYTLRTRPVFGVPQVKERIKKVAYAVLIAVAILVGIHSYLLDGLDGWLLSLSGEDTLYAPAYSDAKFRRVSRGMTQAEVLRLLGNPLAETWRYERPECKEWIFFERQRVQEVVAESEKLKSIKAGSVSEEVLRIAGVPTSVSLIYARSPTDNSHRVRSIHLQQGKVTSATHYFYAD